MKRIFLLLLIISVGCTRYNYYYEYTIEVKHTNGLKHTYSGYQKGPKGAILKLRADKSLYLGDAELVPMVDSFCYSEFMAYLYPYKRRKIK